MKILLDTHIFLWMLSSPEKINEKRLYALKSRINEVFLSAMSIAELMIKHSIGKMQIAFDPMDMAEKTGLDLLDFSGREALMLGQLPLHHKDPFDRMIIAQPIVNDLPVMTDDSKFRHFDCKLV